MDDRPLPWRLLSGCRNGLEETRFGGFFVASQKRLVDSDASWVELVVIAIYFRQR
jgi:hypothetical protein